MSLPNRMRRMNAGTWSGWASLFRLNKLKDPSVIHNPTTGPEEGTTHRTAVVHLTQGDGPFRARFRSSWPWKGAPIGIPVSPLGGQCSIPRPRRGIFSSPHPLSPLKKEYRHGRSPNPLRTP